VLSLEVSQRYDAGCGPSRAFKAVAVKLMPMISFVATHLVVAVLLHVAETGITFVVTRDDGTLIPVLYKVDGELHCRRVPR
jgi:hypothetical protein